MREGGREGGGERERGGGERESDCDLCVCVCVLCTGIEQLEEKVEAHDEDMKGCKKTLNEERIKKVEAINKLAQVSITCSSCAVSHYHPCCCCCCCCCR